MNTKHIKVKQYYSYEASRGAGAQSVTVKPTGYGFVPTRGDEIFT